MRDACDQPPERGEFFGLDQRILRFPQVAQRQLGRILGLAHFEFDALALADIERNGDDVLDLAGRIQDRQLVDQPLPHVPGGILVLLLVEAEFPGSRQHALVMLVGLGRAVARHQVGSGAADRVLGLYRDFRSIEGRAAGVRTLGVTWGYHPEAALRAAGPDALIGDYTQIGPTLEHLWRLA